MWEDAQGIICDKAKHTIATMITNMWPYEDVCVQDRRRQGQREREREREGRKRKREEGEREKRVRIQNRYWPVSVTRLWREHSCLQNN